MINRVLYPDRKNKKIKTDDNYSGKTTGIHKYYILGDDNVLTPKVGAHEG